MPLPDAPMFGACRLECNFGAEVSLLKVAQPQHQVAAKKVNLDTAEGVNLRVECLGSRQRRLRLHQVGRIRLHNPQRVEGLNLQQRIARPLRSTHSLLRQFGAPCQPTLQAQIDDQLRQGNDQRAVIARSQ